MNFSQSKERFIAKIGNKVKLSTILYCLDNTNIRRALLYQNKFKQAIHIYVMFSTCHKG